MLGNTLDLEKLTYKVQMIKFNIEDKHAEFIFKVLTPIGISFHLVDRYSSMRQF
jgi:hypothetical protein